MKDFLYWIVYRLADIHTWIMQLNDGFEQSFTDKELHFIVIGVAGLALFLMIHPLIRALCKKGMEILVSLLYTLRWGSRSRTPDTWNLPTSCGVWQASWLLLWFIWW